jgi:protease PrsW
VNVNESVFCGKCGSRLDQGAHFCGTCGARVPRQVSEGKRLSGTDQSTPAVPVAHPESEAQFAAPRPKRVFDRLVLGTVILLIALAVLSVNALILAVQEFDVATLFMAVVATLVPALLYAAFIVLLDIREREPMRLLVFGLLWGALIAAAAAFILNTGIFVVAATAFGTEIGEFLSIVIFAPFIEELAKAGGLLVLFALFRREFHNVTDGIVYGGLIGIGFGLSENVIYLGSAYAESGIEEFTALFFLRVILGGLGHATFTALAGAGFGYLRETDTGCLRIAAPFIGIFAAMMGHAAWNGFFSGIMEIVYDPGDGAINLILIPLVAIGAMLPGYVAILILLIRSWRREARIIATYLEDEVRDGLISQSQLRRLMSTRRRFSFELNELTSRGVRTWRAARQFHQVCTGLAFRKWQLERGTPGQSELNELDAEYRSSIRDLRDRFLGEVR